MRLAIFFATLTALVACCACQELSPRRPKSAGVVWREVGEWSGHGSTQTDSFDLDVLQWRILWNASNENPPGQGTFKVTVNSAVSGRPLSVAVDHKGPGQGTAYVNDDPRLYHLVIDSANLDWKVTVEQPVQTGGE